MTIAQPIPSVFVCDGRGNRLSLDETAFRGNVAVARARAKDGARVLQVVKGDGYGLGLDRMVRWGMAAGVEGFCAGTPEEALRIRALAPDHVALLFTACPTDALAPLAKAGVVVTVNSVAAMAALCDAGVVGAVYLELDCGFGRFGLDATALDAALDRHDTQRAISIAGIYTHFGQGGPAVLERGLAIFDRAVGRVLARVYEPFDTMVASSYTLIERPGLPYSTIDPGRLLYGLIEEASVDGVRPVLTNVASRIIQVNRIAETQTMRIGYGAEMTIPAGGATGVFPLGWRDGLSLRGPMGMVLVRGRRVPVISRTLLHSIVDLSSLSDPSVGEEVVLVGEQAGASITIGDAASAQGISATELHFTLADAITRSAVEAADGS